MISSVTRNTDTSSRRREVLIDRAGSRRIECGCLVNDDDYVVRDKSWREEDGRIDIGRNIKDVDILWLTWNVDRNLIRTGVDNNVCIWIGLRDRDGQGCRRNIWNSRV